MPGGVTELVGDPPGLIGPFLQTIPVQELNEFFVRCNMTPKYEIVSRPTEQEPDFMLKMTVGKMNSMGIGRTKAGAKLSAILQLLRTVIPCPSIHDTDVRRMRYCAETLVMFMDESLPNTVLESLQKVCESRHKPPPFYRVVCEGLAQSFVTVVTCCIGLTMVVGMGKTKKRAKRHAAFKLLFYFRFGPGKYDEVENGPPAIFKESFRDEGGSNAADCGSSHKENIMLIKSALAELTNPTDNTSINGNDEISQNDISHSCVAANDTFHSCMTETTTMDGQFESMENIPAIPYETAELNEMEVGTVLIEGDVKVNRRVRSDETLAVSQSLIASKIEECVNECPESMSNFSENDGSPGNITPIALKKASCELSNGIDDLEDRLYRQELVGDNLIPSDKTKEILGAEGRIPSSRRDWFQQQIRDDKNIFDDVNLDKFSEVAGDAETMRSVVMELDQSSQKGREKKRRQCTTQPNYNNLRNAARFGTERYMFAPECQKHKTNRNAPYSISQDSYNEIKTPSNQNAILISEHLENDQDSLIVKSMKEILQEFPELIQIQVPPSSDEDVCTDSDESHLKVHPVQLSESREFVTSNRCCQGIEHEQAAITDQRFNEENCGTAVILEPGEILVDSGPCHLETSPEPVKREEMSEQEITSQDDMNSEEEKSQPSHVDHRLPLTIAKLSNASVQATMDEVSQEQNRLEDAVLDNQIVNDHLTELKSMTGHLAEKSHIKKPSRMRTVQLVRAGKDKAVLFDNPNDELSKAKVFPSHLGKSAGLVEGCSEETLVPKCQTCGSNNSKPIIVGWETVDFEERWIDPYAWEPLIYIFLQFAMAFVIIVQIVIGVLFIFTDLVTARQLLFSMLQAALVVALVHFS